MMTVKKIAAYLSLLSINKVKNESFCMKRDNMGISFVESIEDDKVLGDWVREENLEEVVRIVETTNINIMRNGGSLDDIHQTVSLEDRLISEIIENTINRQSNPSISTVYLELNPLIRGINRNIEQLNERARVTLNTIQRYNISLNRDMQNRLNILQQALDRQNEISNSFQTYLPMIVIGLISLATFYLIYRTSQRLEEQSTNENKNLRENINKILEYIKNNPDKIKETQNIEENKTLYSIFKDFLNLIKSKIKGVWK